MQKVGVLGREAKICKKWEFWEGGKNMQKVEVLGRGAKNKGQGK